MSRHNVWIAYAWVVVLMAVCTAAGAAMRSRFDVVNIAMVYLLAVLIIAMRFDYGPTVLTAVLAVGLLDFLFVPPAGAFSIDDVQYLLTFSIMLTVGLVVSGLRRRMHDQEQAKAQLVLDAATEEMRNTLLASISHDLRTPLAVMAGASSSLIERGPQLSNDERIALARSIYDQSREMSQRIAKLLDMTRLESGNFRIHLDWATLGEIVESVCRRLDNRLIKHRILVEIPDDLPLIYVDAPLIEQAIGNLLENAVTHTPEGTVVRIRAPRRDKELLVSIEDSGESLADGDVEKLFAKFQRGADKIAGGGVGLGLSIVRAIIKLHGGKAWAERLPDRGMAFRFTIPLVDAPSIPVEGGLR